MRHLGLVYRLATLLCLISSTASAETVIRLEGLAEEPEGSFFEVPFEVPAGTAEIQVTYRYTGESSVLDFGLFAPAGFRGWGGDDDAPAIVNHAAASPSYLPGPIEPGTWRVFIGVALQDRTTPYDVEVVLRETPTLAPQPERRPYQPPPPVEAGARWYAGDLHVHSGESGDSTAGLDDIADFAKMRGLDFVMLSDHNTVSQHQYLGALGERHPQLLILPGIEYTTYRGHANAIGATRWIDPRLDLNEALAAIEESGGILSINHPTMGLGDACRGCDWERPVPEGVAALEIATGGWDPVGYLFIPRTIELWERLEADGKKLAIVGGSDDHRAGRDLASYHSPIGTPTTMVHAEALSVGAIVDAIRRRRTAVKLQGPDDPSIDLRLDGQRTGSTVEADGADLAVEVTGGRGLELVLYRNGALFERRSIDADPFAYVVGVEAPENRARTDRFHAEVAEGERPRTLTSHAYLTAGSGCRCVEGSSGGLTALLLVGLLLGMRQREASPRVRGPAR